MAASRMFINNNSLWVSKKLNILKKVDGVPYVPHTKVTEELGIPIGKVTDKMLWWSDTGECVLKTAANYANSAYVCNKF